MLSFNIDTSKGETPASVARKRAIVQALMASQGAPKNIGEGLNALGDGIVENVLNRRADAAEQAGQAHAADIFGGLSNAGIFPPAPSGGPASPTTPIASASPRADNPNLPSSMDFAQAQAAPSSGSASDLEAYIRQAAVIRGIDPDVAVTVARSEGGLKDPVRRSDYAKGGMREPSYGPFQLLVGGDGTGFPEGMGNAALKAGIDPRDPANWQKGVDFALDQAKTNGWGAWYGAKAHGITGMHGIGQAQAAQAAPQQVASLDPSVGMPPAPIAAPPPTATSLPAQAPIPEPSPMASAPGAPAPLPDDQFNSRFGGVTQALTAANPLVAAPAAPSPVVEALAAAQQPQQAAPASPGVQQVAQAMQPQTGKPQGPGRPGEIRQGSDGKNYQYAQTTGMAGATGDQGWIETSMPAQGGGADNLPVMAGGGADAIQPGQAGPSIQQIMQVAADPWASPEQKAMASMMLKQRLDQQDPSNQLDMDYKRAQIAALNAKQDALPDSVKALKERASAAGLIEGTPEYKNFMVTGGHGPATVINTGDNSSAFAKKSDESAAKRMDDIVTAGQAAPQTMADMQQLVDLGAQIGTGKLADWKSTLGPYAQAAGIDVGGMDEIQAYKAITSRLAPQMRAVGSGSSSDTDVAMFMQSLPNLRNTQGGNEMIANTMKSVAQNKMNAAEIARKAQRGDITWQDADEQISKLPNPYDLFKEFQKQSAKKPTVIDGYTIEEVP